MKLLETIAHEVAIGGLVIHKQTERPLPNARVTIVEAPDAFDRQQALNEQRYGAQWQKLEERIDRTRTDANGRFHFLDLPDGEYHLEASMPQAPTSFGTKQSAALIVPHAEEPFTFVTLALPPTTVSGTVTDNAGNGILLSRVAVQGMNLKTFSDEDGRYRLNGIDVAAGAGTPASYTLEVTARGFTPAQQIVTFDNPGDEREVNVQLMLPS